MEGCFTHNDELSTTPIQFLPVEIRSIWEEAAVLKENGPGNSYRNEAQTHLPCKIVDSHKHLILKDIKSQPKNENQEMIIVKLVTCIVD